MVKERAWIYARDRHGKPAIEEQIRKIAREADKTGYEVVGASVDTVYRKIIPRRGLHRMMKAIRRNEMDVVMVERLGKLSHRNWLLKLILRSMERHNISLYITGEDSAMAFYFRGLRPEQIISSYI